MSKILELLMASFKVLEIKGVITKEEYNKIENELHAKQPIPYGGLNIIIEEVLGKGEQDG